MFYLFIYKGLLELQMTFGPTASSTSAGNKTKWIENLQRICVALRDNDKTSTKRK